MTTKLGRSEGGITRRQFLSGTAAAAGCLAGGAAGRLFSGPAAAAQEPGSLPRVASSWRPDPTKPRPKVIHVFNGRATSWDYVTGWYGDYVNQHQVGRMVDEGVMALTGAASVAEGWWGLIPGYVPGERIAIKVNLNNAGSADDGDNEIDALIEPVNSVIAGLRAAGVVESDIWVYDASRPMPNRFRNGCDYAGVQFSGHSPEGFSDTERVVFAPPPGAPSLEDRLISQVLVDTHYLINMPIMKKHARAHVTLSFKNHFGSIDMRWLLHESTFPDAGVYRPDYNPLVDIYQNPHFRGKTVLTIGDGLFASRGDQSTPPAPWATFGNRAPNSLFFSRDPVAIDCVMYDFLEAEAGLLPGADDYLLLAAQAGLGVFEHRAPGAIDPAGWYSLIDYVPLDLTPGPAHTIYLPSVRR